ncbi:MAG: hypothetical protein KY461_01425 [Actinobacteria bacterium]|nr:hypothetical protein [Actinomycetota bacterium]
MADGRQRGSGGTAGFVVLAALSLLAACSAPSAEVERPPTEAAELAAVPLAAQRSPAGVVRVAYPDEPAGFLDLRHDDAAAADLGAIWGLPMFRVDPHGQLAAGLVAHWETSSAPDGGWRIELALREGRWSDGSAVTAADVVATLEALRAGPRAAELAPLTSVTAVDDRRVQLGFRMPYGRWWSLLDGVGVLPATVLAGSGPDAYADDIPVAGGWFSLGEHVPGLRTSFVANPDGALGAPGVERLEVLVVPRYEAALGMLREGEVDAVLGYLALNPVERARRVDDVQAAAPIGGTTVTLAWRPAGPLGAPAAAPRRRAIAAALDVSQLVEGLLGPSGAPASSVVPGAAPGATPSDDPVADVGEPVVVLPRWQEATAFTARALQRDLRTAGGGMALVGEVTPDVVGLARSTGDGALVARRAGPWPTLVGSVHDPALALAGDAGGPGSAALSDALAGAAEDALVVPLYRIGVAHAWSDALIGVRPSAWPGLAFWDAGAWAVAVPGGP